MACSQQLGISESDLADKKVKLEDNVVREITETPLLAQHEIHWSSPENMNPCWRPSQIFSLPKNVCLCVYGGRAEKSQD